MTRFSYRAITADGSPVRGTLEAADVEAVSTRMQRDGLVPVDIQPVRRGLIEALSQERGAKTKLSLRQQVLFCEYMQALLKAGLPVDQALALVADQCESAAEQRLVGATLAAVQQGQALSRALAQRDAFPSLVDSIVEASEATGRLAAGFADLARYLKRKAQVSSQLSSALFYPAIVLIMVLVSLLVVLLLVIPKFEPVFLGIEDQLPGLTQAVLWLSRAAREGGAVMVALMFGLPLALVLGLRDPRLRSGFDRALLHLPVLGPVLFKSVMAQAYHVMGTALNSGIPLPNAIDMAARTLTNRHVRQGLAAASEQVRTGQPFSNSLNFDDQLPRMARNLARVGEQAADLGPMLLEAASFMEQDAARKLDRLINVLNPLSTIGLGGLVAILVAGVMLGILSLSSIGF